MAIRVGDIVGRISYGEDILFRVVDIRQNDVLLKGVHFRLVVDAPYDDLQKVTDQEQKERKKKNKEKEEASLRLIKQEHRLMREKIQWFLTGSYQTENLSYELPGNVLHIDGDPQYLKKCLAVYDELNIPCYGIHVSERDIPARIGSLLRSVQPDILVITGHDSWKQKAGDLHNLDTYRNTKYFIQGVREARKFERDRDALQIFAGACQSNYEALLKAGANYGSAPRRINIHCLDPVYVVEKSAYTPIRDTVNMFELVKNTISGLDGVGGIESQGTLRVGMPEPNPYPKKQKNIENA